MSMLWDEWQTTPEFLSCHLKQRPNMTATQILEITQKIQKRHIDMVRVHIFVNEAPQPRDYSMFLSSTVRDLRLEIAQGGHIIPLMHQGPLTLSDPLETEFDLPDDKYLKEHETLADLGILDGQTLYMQLD
jgi:hypothetical protein